MKKIVVVVMLLIRILGFGQGEINTNSLQLPNINPPSPESFKFTEYGKNGINEYSGKLNVNIPIFEYKAGNLTMPITINYSGAGVKVEDISNWTGTNWNLIVGGVISRQINDGSDEFTVRKFVDENDMKINAIDLCAPNSQFYWDLAANESAYDTEVDIFNFNFMGYSGTFYLDSNFNPIYLENENEIKIQIIGSYTSNQENFIQNKAFLITTPDGVKYFFGGIQTETTRVLSGTHSIDADGITSYFLHKIEHPVNGTIILEYESLDSKTQILSKSYDMTTGICDANGIGQAINVMNFVERKFVTKIMNPKRLKKIKSLDNNIEVSFLRSDYNSNVNFNSVLNSIEIVNNQSPTVLLKIINFSYEAKVNPQSLSNDFLNASRFFLTNLEINKNLNGLTNQYEKYSFEYNDPFGLPDRMSNSRDALGYFNNKNNTSLVPIWKENTYYFFNLPQNFANLDPSFEYAKKGSLTKIIYPTSGYSKFEYEPIPAKKKKITPYYFNINTYDWNELGYPFEMIVPGDNESSIGTIHTDFPTVYEDQTITFNIDINIMAHSGGSTSLAGKGVEFIIRDLGTQEEIVFTRVFPLTTIPDFTYNLKKGHNYSFRLRFKGINTSAALTSSLAFEVFEGYTVIEGLGIRLKRDTNFNFDNTQTDQRRYYYGTINGGYNDVSSFNFLDYNPKRTYIKGSLENVGTGLSTYALSAIFSSDIVAIGNAIFENPEKFPVISLSFGGDNFENGGIEKHFLNIPDKYSSAKRLFIENDGCWAGLDGLVDCGLPEISGNVAIIRGQYKTYEKSNIGYYNGKLLCERTYINNNGLFKIKEQQFNYDLSENTSKKMTNFVGRTIFSSMALTNHCPDINGPAYVPLSSSYFAYYFTNSLSFKLINSTSTDYINPVPMANYVDFYYENYLLFFYGNLAEEIGEQNPIDQEAVEAPFKKIITKQNNEYGALRGLPTQITTTVSDGSTKKIRNIYVDKANTLVGFTPTQQNSYDKLVEQNNVATPIQEEQYRNNELLSTQRTIYNELPTDVNKILPSIIQTAKASNGLEDRVVFSEYDNKGNPTLLSYKDGSKTKYIYNTDNQVIAKIENFTGTLNANTNSITGSVCLFIDSFPSSMVTVYSYHPTTKLLIEIVDPKCDKITYEYDAFNRLKSVKDKNGNILSENEYHYKN